MTQTIHWKNGDWYCHGVLDGALSVDRVYENEQALAFRAPPDHRNEAYDTHLIVIPKRHIVTLLDLGPADQQLITGLFDAVKGAARALDLDHDGRGFILRANVLPPQQHTGHIHLHMLSGARH